MRYRTLATVLILGLMLGCDGCPPKPDEPGDETTTAPEGRKVALLIAAEFAEISAITNSSEFWHDTVLTYCMLRKNGFLPEDIYVLYSDGADGYHVQPSQVAQDDLELLEEPDNYDPDSEYCGSGGETPPITDLPMTTSDGVIDCREDSPGNWECQPRWILDCLANGNCTDPKTGDTIKALTSEDFLFVWWKGHGDEYAPGQSATQSGQDQQQAAGADDAGTLMLQVGVGLVSEETLLAWMDAVPAKRRLYVFETCESGCMASHFREDPTAILLTACDCGEDANNWDTHDTWHGLFTFWIDATLGGWTPASIKNPLNINTSLGQSVAQAYGQSKTATEHDAAPSAEQVPQKADPDDTAGSTYLTSSASGN